MDKKTKGSEYHCPKCHTVHSPLKMCPEELKKALEMDRLQEDSMRKYR